VINRLGLLILSGLLLASPSMVAQAKNVTPDPDGLPPQDVKDLHYGDVLFYFYQDDDFEAITRLGAYQHWNLVPHHEAEGQLLLGGLYLSLGLHNEAGELFQSFDFFREQAGKDIVFALTILTLMFFQKISDYLFGRGNTFVRFFF